MNDLLVDSMCMYQGPVPPLLPEKSVSVSSEQENVEQATPDRPIIEVSRPAFSPMILKVTFVQISISGIIVVQSYF